VGLQVSIRKSGDVTILDLRGRSTIDSGESELLGSHLQELVASGVRKLLLNLAELTQVDSSGISSIVATYVSLRDQGGDLRLLRPCGRVLEVFRVLRLLETIPSFEDEAQAVGSFRPQGAPTPQKSALVVSSGGDIDELLMSVLIAEGWDIQRVVDNQDALSLSREKPFDLIITGRKTCGSEDIELLRKIRSARPHVRLIILTDKWTSGDVIAAMREGAFSYFSAPFEASELVEMVRAAMVEPYWDDGIEILSATPTWVRLTARCDLPTADRLVQFLHGVGDIPEADKDQVINAFREILINAMEHGANFNPNQYVEISFIRSHRAITCRVRDPGKGFSLEELRHAAIGSSPEDLLSHMAVREEQGLRPGGFGILLAKKLVDELIYDEKGNDVLLVKYLDRPRIASTGRRPK
jgi:anti-anti-sigma factor